MRLSHVLVCAVVAIAFSRGIAQVAPITTDTSPSHQQIMSWLSSGDPRLVAWGAYFARETADDGATAQLSKLAEPWTAPKPDAAQREQFRTEAMDQVLDALIEEQADVAPRAVAAIAPSFPNQAAILASRLPIADATPLLLGWYGGGKDNPTSILQRVAAMLLSKAPPPGFAASVVAESQEHMTVLVVANEGGGVGGGRCTACGQSIAGPGSDDWPPPVAYRIQENLRRTGDPLVVEAGGDRITWQRLTANDGWGTCASVRPLTDETRYDLLAEMSGVAKKDIPWPLQQSTSIQWTGSDDFLSAMQRQIGEEEAKLRETAEVLFARGYLSVDEVQSVRTKLLVHVLDFRHTSETLPRWVPDDEQTVIDYVWR